jgi:hypothetical protein
MKQFKQKFRPEVAEVNTSGSKWEYVLWSAVQLPAQSTDIGSNRKLIA